MAMLDVDTNIEQNHYKYYNIVLFLLYYKKLTK